MPLLFKEAVILYLRRRHVVSLIDRSPVSYGLPKDISIWALRGILPSV
jgi:hypothetical protein